MEGNDSGEVSVMSEVDISEDLPNGDDSAFTNEEPQQHTADSEHEHIAVQTADGVAIATSQGGIPPNHVPVFVATSQGLLAAEPLHDETGAIKTTHIVIHDQTLSVDPHDPSSGLKTPTTPLPPPTPATPLSKEKGFKYQWDDSVHANILPVRCKSSNGELHKAKFGSGGRGRCIKMADNWYTPSEFEAVCGRASSKDWKRSIRYGGRTLQCLIEDGILQPHATSCTCAACCDDETVTGPVRLFVPYKRRKRDSESSSPVSGVVRKPRTASTKSPTVIPSPVSKDGGWPGDTSSACLINTDQSSAKGSVISGVPVVVSLAPGTSLARPLSVSNTETGEMVQIITADASGNFIAGDTAVVMTPLPQTPKPTANANAAQGHGQNVVNSMDVHEQRQWWQLEEMANSLIQQAQSLKAMIDHARQQSVASKEASLQQLKAQLDKEKAEAVNAVRIEAQINLSKTLMEERAQKDIAIQQALAQVRAHDMQEKMEAVTVVGEDKQTYSVTWAHQHNQNNIGTIMDGEGDESDKEK